MRATLPMLALSVLVAGCTVTTGGVPAPAQTLGRAPAPLPAGSLRGLLLGVEQLDTLTGASGLTVIRSGEKMYGNHTPDDDCVVGWINVHQDVYAGSGWTAMRRQELREPGDDYSHIVFQAVVSFPEAIDAHDFYTKQVAGWSACDNRRINERNVRDPDDTDSYWSLREAKEADGVLTMSRVAEGGEGWACQRALTARNNVVVDVDVCAADVADEGGEIATAIAEKVSTEE